MLLLMHNLYCNTHMCVCVLFYPHPNVKMCISCVLYVCQVPSAFDAGEWRAGGAGTVS